ncbi:MAG: MotA/TolQ/ExbB proton channel family protein [Verrucomicrobiales bacterium]|nr:MotA/TolQ/ExbB proton channel family protein [Verrucomicrobiales bacterium]
MNTTQSLNRLADKAQGEATKPGPDTLSLNWTEEDIENRIGLFKAGRYTSPNKMVGFGLATLLTAAFFTLVVYVFSATPFLQQFAIVFIRQGNLYTTGPATFFFFWAMSLLLLKRLKLKYQERALNLAAVPQHPDFVLNEASAKAVLERIHAHVDHPRHFILLNRIDRALSNLRNIGGLSDVSTILKGQAENDENQIASSYTLISGMVWAIPVLGFIGTVQGLSSAIGTFTKTLASAADLNAIKSNLQGVTGGLSTAFETTLVALVMALFIQLYLNSLQKRETDFLDECNDYCHQHVISKLRLVEKVPPNATLAPGSSASDNADKNQLGGVGL